MRIAAVVVALCFLAQGPAFARAKRAKHVKKPRPTPTASSDAEGRSHLKKANALAAKNNCEAAIEEYTFAFDRLNDPAVLLARADCRQRVGQNAEAAEDLQAYLDESPDVANRAEIEAKIAALETRPAKETPPAKETQSPKEMPRHEEAATPPPSPPPREKTAPPREKSTPPAPLAAPKPDEATSPSLTSSAPIVTPQAAVEVKAPLVEGAPGPAEHQGRLWLWTAVAVLVAGGATVAGYFYFRPADATPPQTSLGNYRF